MAEIKINTNLLRNYAERIESVNRRLYRLDKRIDKLYFRVGLLGLYNLIAADLITAYSWKLNSVQRYLTETANDFEYIEKDLQYYNPLNFKNSNSNSSIIKQESVIGNSRILFLPKYNDFNSKFSPSYTIPGLNNGFVPQGITCDEDDGYIIISGYDENGKASRLMILDAETGELVKSITLKNEDNSDYTGHAGGVVYVDGQIYITSDDKIYKVSHDELLNAKDEDAIVLEKVRDINTKGSYVTAKNGTLYTGNFLKNDKKSGVKLDEGTVIDEPLCEAYDLKEGKPGEKPRYYITTPKQVQGMDVKDNGDIIFTTSYGKGNESKIYQYSDVTKSKAIGHIGGIPVYAALDDMLKETTTAPPMIEGVCSGNGKTYTVFESGAKKYRTKASSKDPVDTIYVSDSY